MDAPCRNGRGAGAAAQSPTPVITVGASTWTTNGTHWMDGDTDKLKQAEVDTQTNLLLEQQEHLYVQATEMLHTCTDTQPHRNTHTDTPILCTNSQSQTHSVE